MTGERGGTRDLGRLLGLSGPGAWMLAGLFWATYLVIAHFSGGRPMQHWQGHTSLVLILICAVVLVLPWRTPLPLPVVFGVIGVVVFTSAAMSWLLPTEGWPGWTSWHFAADNFLLFMVALRGRVWWGALGVSLMTGIAMLWTFTTTGDPTRGFLLTYWQVASYLAGAFFALWLRRTARQIAEFQETERRRVAEEQARESAADERRRHLERVRSQAGPALARIASGDVDDEARRDHGLLEAELRDQIRGRKLAVDPLPAALREARSRGIAASVLDDLRDEDALTRAEKGYAATWAAERVGETRTGPITIRLARVDGEPTVTVSTADGGTASFRPRISRPGR